MANSRLSTLLDDMKWKIPTRFDDVVVVVDAVDLNRHARIIKLLNFFEDTLLKLRITIEAESLVDEPLHGRWTRLHPSQDLHDLLEVVFPCHGRVIFPTHRIKIDLLLDGFNCALIFQRVPHFL